MYLRAKVMSIVNYKNENLSNRSSRSPPFWFCICVKQFLEEGSCSKIIQLGPIKHYWRRMSWRSTSPWSSTSWSGRDLLWGWSRSGTWLVPWLRRRRWHSSTSRYRLKIISRQRCWSNSNSIICTLSFSYLSSIRDITRMQSFCRNCQT